MKLCRALYGHGCTCDCTQVISKPAAVCLGSCEPAAPCPPWTCFVLKIERVFRWFEDSSALKAPLAGRYRAVLSCFLTVCSGPSELWQELDVHVLLPVPWNLCENLSVKVPGLSLHVLICGTGHLGRGRKQLQKLIDHDLLVYAFYFTLKLEFDVLVVGNSSLLVWVFKKNYLYIYF